jgi:hypothetical protein
MNKISDMLHILTKVKIVIMSIIDSIRICFANSNESDKLYNNIIYVVMSSIQFIIIYICL